MLEPASIFSPVCSDLRCIANIFLGPRVPTKSSMARGVLVRFLSQRFFIVLPPPVRSLLGLDCVSVSWFVRFRLTLEDPVTGSQSWVRVESFLSRCCRPGLEALWQRVSSHETASASLMVSLSSGFRPMTVATRSSLSSPIIIVIWWRLILCLQAGLLCLQGLVEHSSTGYFECRFFRRRCARHVLLLYVCGGLNGCIRSRSWRVGDSNLQHSVPNDGTACFVDSSSCCR